MKGYNQRIPMSLISTNAPVFPNVAGPASTSHWCAVEGQSILSIDHGPGYIFMCNGTTKVDCYKYRVFGLPSSRMDIVEKIKPQTKLFLFDFDVKLLYGVYIAASNGKLAIEPAAFGGNSLLMGGSKFSQELSSKQVANLISLFRPVAEPSPGSRPAADLSDKYDQCLAKLQHFHTGAARDIRRDYQIGLSLPYIPHAPVETISNLQPHFVSQPHFGPFKLREANQTCPENPSLDSRYNGMAHDAERTNVQQLESANVLQEHVKFSASEQRHEQLPTFSQTDGYWVQVASADPKQAYSSPHQWIPSASIGGQKSSPFSAVAQAYPTMQDSNDTETVKQSNSINNHNNAIMMAATDVHVPTESLMPSHFQAPSHGPEHQSSSCGAVCWVAPVYQNPACVYAVRNEPSGGTAFRTDNAYTSLRGVTPSHTAAPDRNVKHVPQLSYPYGYQQQFAVSSINIPLESHGQLPPQVPAHLNGSANYLSSSSAASYWPGLAYRHPSQVYLHPHQLPSGNIASCNPNVVAPLQPHAHIPSQFPAVSYVPLSSG